MSFTVTTDTGVVSAHVPAGGYTDAACSESGAMAGFEFAVDGVTCNDSPRSERHAQCTVTVSMDQMTMRAWAMLLAVKSGMPAFTVSEWAEIATALDMSDVERRSDRGGKLAARIRDAYPGMR
jgi:hypothetical protein